MSNLITPEMEKTAHPDHVIKVGEKCKAIKVMDLQSPVFGNDPNELIKHRFLYRGGIMILTGPTGAGKSSFTMQWAFNLAGGAAMFGLRIGNCYYQKGLKVLVIQAENDEGDLAEQRDGVLSVLPCDVINRASENLSFVTMPDASGDVFAERLDALCAIHEPDVVFIDPVFSFLGGDNNAQKDVSNWVRNLILPILMKYKCATVLIHHNNKPQKDAVKSGAYTMAGSAEWANAARAVLTLEPVGDGTYALSAVKRGDRLGWKDESGTKTKTQYISYHGGQDENGSPIIAWREATEDEIPKFTEGGRGRKVTVKDVVNALNGRPLTAVKDLQKMLMDDTDASLSLVKERISESTQLGLIQSTRLGRNVFYSEVNNTART